MLFFKERKGCLDGGSAMCRSGQVAGGTSGGDSPLFELVDAASKSW